MGETTSSYFSAILHRILFIFAGNAYMHKSLDEFEIRPDATTVFHGNRQGYSGNQRANGPVNAHLTSVSCFSIVFQI